MSVSCEAAVILGGHAPGSATAEALKAYGRHLGIAYQLVDDLLDCSGEGQLGASTLFAAEEHPEIRAMVEREGDVAVAEAVAQLVKSSRGARRATELAEAHARQAAEALGALEPSAARDGLLRLCFEVLNRRS